MKKTLAALLVGSLASCASLNFERTTQTSGTFEATAVAVTVFKIDLPKSALQITRENLADANLANMQVEEVSVVPDLGWWNWVLDILSVRRARIAGRWGFAGGDRP
jgi:hypothetical protein